MKRISFTLIIALILAIVPGVVSASDLAISSNRADPGDTAVLIQVSLDNSVAYAGMELVLEFDASVITLDRIEPASRMSTMSDMGYYEYTTGKVAAVVFDLSGVNVPADTGVVMNLYFDVDPDVLHTEGLITISEVTAVDENMLYDSVDVAGGSIGVPSYMCGDIDASLSIDIADLTYLVSYMFKSGPEPPELLAADLDCSGGLDIADLTYLVGYMFKSGADPCAPCTVPFAKVNEENLKGIVEIVPDITEEGQSRLLVTADFAIPVAGFQQEYTFDQSVVIDSIKPAPAHKEVPLYYSAVNGTISLGMIDIYGKHLISSGEVELLVIYYHWQNDEMASTRAIRHVKSMAADEHSQKLSLTVMAGEESDELLPSTFALHANYPNPFNPTTTIKYALPQASHVTIAVFNVLGQRVTTLVDEPKEAGYHEVVWDGCNTSGDQVASGVYFYRITAGSFEDSRKMVLVK